MEWLESEWRGGRLSCRLVWCLHARGSAGRRNGTGERRPTIGQETVNAGKRKFRHGGIPNAGPPLFPAMPDTDLPPIHWGREPARGGLSHSEASRILQTSAAIVIQFLESIKRSCSFSFKAIIDLSPTDYLAERQWKKSMTSLSLSRLSEMNIRAMLKFESPSLPWNEIRLPSISCRITRGSVRNVNSLPDAKIALKQTIFLKYRKNLNHSEKRSKSYTT